MKILIQESRAKLPWARYFQEHTRRLDKQLRRRGVESGARQDIRDSGFILWDDGLPAYKVGPVGPVVHDGLYGSKWGFGLVPLEEFSRWALRRDPKKRPRYLTAFGALAEPRHRPPDEYRVTSLREAETILSRPEHSHYVQSGRMVFRGQTRQYWLRRAFPNPFVSDADGREPLIVPAFWRRYLTNIGSRPFRDEPKSVLTSEVGYPLLYAGIPNWQEQERRRRLDYPQLDELRSIVETQDTMAFERYCAKHGHLLPVSDLPKRVSDSGYALFLKRWLAAHVLSHTTSSEESTVLEQHYGMDTCGLDVTFDLSVAAFFACNQFVMADRERHLADYQLIAPGEHQGVIYCLVFEDPPLERTSDLVSKFELFDELPPTRPLRQSCALPYFHAEHFNEAATEVHSIFYIDKMFCSQDLPTKRHLFPAPADDPFYAALLELKHRDPKNFGQVVEYEFGN
jgi:hypothetical protein